MTPADPGLYDGVVTHVRHAPHRHRLRYRMFMLLLDIDRLDETVAGLKRLSRNRFNWFSFHDRDHLPKDAGKDADLRGFIEGHMRAAGLAPDGGPVQLLCMPRMLGYVFNPLSVWFCWRRTGELAAVLYEVRNTFGEAHSYLIPAPEPGNRPVVEQDCDKGFFVSPFMDMDLHYHFRVRPPGETTVLDIAVSKRADQSKMLDARFAAERRPLTDATLAAALREHPLMTLKVIGGIHWEAVKIVLKGIGLRPRAPLPPTPVSYIAAG
jgi:DUF1365 family protein